MAKPLTVLFLSSEVEPFAKTGGLADVAGALPPALKRLGAEVRVMMPRYGSIKERAHKLHEMIRLKEIPVPVGSRSRIASVKSAFLSHGQEKVQVYFVENKALFGRTGLYVHPESQKDYEDNDLRFAFFSRSVFEILKQMRWAPDIIHCNDWHTGLVPAYLRTLYAADPFFKHTRTVLTIHNIAYQGEFPATAYGATGLPEDPALREALTARGKINYLKAGLVFAHALTAVSERYAEEIRSGPEFGYGLEDVVQSRAGELRGILNGADYLQWDPEHDPLIPHRYGARSLDLKQESKKALVEKMGLTFSPTTAVIGIVSRLATQKGFDLIGEILDELMTMDLQLVVLGTGEKQYHDLFTRAAKKHPGKLAVALRFDHALAHLIEAGSDMFLMPSRYEPCGLNQLYSLRYGTVPVVRATGGLADTVEDFDGVTGTGFAFEKYDSHELLATVRRAVKTFADQAEWTKIMKAGMAKDFSWDASARKYLQTYRSVLKT
jgi:starch synthase